MTFALAIFLYFLVGILIAGVVHKQGPLAEDTATIIAIIWPLALIILVFAGLVWLIQRAVKKIGGQEFLIDDDPL